MSEPNISIALSNAIQKVADLTADRDEWKQQHENLLSVRQSDLQVIEKKDIALKRCYDKAEMMSDQFNKLYAKYKLRTSELETAQAEIARLIKFIQHVKACSPSSVSPKAIEEALAIESPSTALQEYRDKIIEQCAEKCSSMNLYTGLDCADVLRDFKDKS